MTNPVGNFIWYELMTSDADAAADFYGGVIGWTFGTRTDNGPAGREYRMIGRSDGGIEGGVLALTSDGGMALMPTLDLPVGRIAFIADPMGVPLYVMTPAPPADKPDARSDVFDATAKQRVNWNELASPDLLGARSFYAKHFGFRFNEGVNMGPLGEYCFIAHGAMSRIGAIMQAPKDAPSSGWLFYFGVDSVTTAQKAIESRGGKVLSGPLEVPGGLWIIIAADPQGAGFGVLGPKGA